MAISSSLEGVISELEVAIGSLEMGDTLSQDGRNHGWGICPCDRALPHGQM